MLGIVDLALRRPWALLGANLAVAGIAIVASLGTPGDLGVGSTRLDGERQEALAVVLERDRATGPGALAVARDVVASQLEADPAIESVRAVDGQRRSVLLAELEAISAAAREDAVERIERRIDPGELQVTVGGETPALIEARRFLGDDLWRLGLLVLPLVLLLAVVATAGIRLAIAPVVCAVTAVAGSFALLRLTGVAFDVSLLGITPAFAVGTVLGIEMPALVARLHREEAGISPAPAALRSTVERAGPLLAGAAGAGSLPALALLATPLPQAASLALGCALAATLAAASAITATPAAIAIFGDRRATGQAAAGDRAGRGRRLAEAIRAVPGLVASSRVRCGLVALVALVAGLAIAYPALEGSSRPFVTADLPPASDLPRATGQALAHGGAPGGSLLGELPVAAAIAAALLAAALGVATRRPGALLAVPFALLPAAAGLGACVYVLDQGHLAGVIGTSGRGLLDTAAVSAAAAALAAIGAARAAIALQAVRTQRQLGVDARGAAELAAGLVLPGGAAAALAGAAISAALVGSDLAVARELGLAVAAGLLVDLALVRVPLLTSLARWGAPAKETG